MEFKSTSINKRRRRAAGFTMIEMMLSSGLGLLVMATTMGVSLYTSQSIASLTDSVNLNTQSRLVIDRMSKKIRQATAVTSFSPSFITVEYEGTALTYAYIAQTGRLVEIQDRRTVILLENCSSLTFELFKRNPVTNSFDQFPASTVLNEAKLVRVSWLCETRNLGKRLGSSEMISAKIVLRSK
jgi:hypothetical protein